MTISTFCFTRAPLVLTEKWPFTLVLRMLYPYKISLQIRFSLLLNFTIGTFVVTLVTFRNLLLYPKGIVNLFVWERHCMSFLLGCNFQITFTHPISTHISVHTILKIIVCIFLICLHFGPTNKRVQCIPYGVKGDRASVFGWEGDHLDDAGDNPSGVGIFRRGPSPVRQTQKKKV